MPYGDPNVLDEGPIRGGIDGEGEGLNATYSLTSNFDLKLEVIYEQKFIGDVDPGLAFHDIMNNVLHMGTSDVKILGNPSSKFYKSIIAAAPSTDTH